MIQAILFDFDETLQLGTQLEMEARVLKTLELLGSTIEDQKLNNILQLRDWRDIRSALVKHVNLSREALCTDEDYNAANNKISGTLDHLFTLAPHAKELLEAIKKSGKKLGLVTTRGSHSLYRILEGHGIKHLFDVIVDRDQTKERKPHPQPIATALLALGVAGRDAVYVGDKQVDDIIAGNALKMETVLIMKEDLDPLGAVPTWKFDSLEPLLEMYG